MRQRSFAAVLGLAAALVAQAAALVWALVRTPWGATTSPGSTSSCERVYGVSTAPPTDGCESDRYSYKL